MSDEDLRFRYVWPWAGACAKKGTLCLSVPLKLDLACVASGAGRRTCFFAENNLQTSGGYKIGPHAVYPL